MALGMTKRAFPINQSTTYRSTNQLSRMSLTAFQRELRSHRNPEKARILSGFFKTGPGEYGAGDRFFGIPVPVIRTLIRAHPELSEQDAYALMTSPWHEERLGASILLVRATEQGTDADLARIAKRYIASTKWMNNWDIIDTSAPQIVGVWLQTRPRTVLDRLAKSPDLWKRRIAIVSTLHFIRCHDLDDCFRICTILMKDQHDLIHKACGWMLREAGKRDEKRLTTFLNDYCGMMPRTMLRYAIEKYPEAKRRQFLRAPRRP
jgi:3-methyladenine DNA glycosylase AlkD